MLSVHLFLVGGVMLSCCTASSLDWYASWSSQRRKTARFLAELKSVPAYQCLRDRTDFRCPWKKGPIAQVKLEEATSCYRQMLWQVFHLFDSEASRAAWPEMELDQLLDSLWSELQVLERTREQGQSCPLPFALAIRTYFRGFFRYLEGKAHSPCSWEIVRVEMQAALSAFPLSGRRSPKKRSSSLQEESLLS
ncbi:interferon alpha-3-like [Grammomys surdaster]|uniref:interferon alpha-3-like n=1 Tax=Grammomys surdaster TaxID=491861 RepID=UPI00109FD850|nr:interferon alpha-3-like [Grammomys surdaster]